MKIFQVAKFYVRKDFEELMGNSLIIAKLETPDV